MAPYPCESQLDLPIHFTPLPSSMLLKGVADLTFLHWNNTVDGNHLTIHREIVACRIQSMSTKELLFINSLKEFSIHSVDWIRKTIFIRFPSLLFPFLPPSPPLACKFPCLSPMYDWCNLNVFSYRNHLHLFQMSCSVTFFYLQDPSWVVLEVVVDVIRSPDLMFAQHLQSFVINYGNQES